MSAALELHDEISGFHPGNQGSALVVYDHGDVVVFATKYTVPFEEDADGWDWAIGTRLNVADATALRDYLTAHLTKIGA